MRFFLSLVLWVLLFVGCSPADGLMAASNSSSVRKANGLANHHKSGDIDGDSLCRRYETASNPDHYKYKTCSCLKKCKTLEWYLAELKVCPGKRMFLLVPTTKEEIAKQEAFDRELNNGVYTRHKENYSNWLNHCFHLDLQYSSFLLKEFYARKSSDIGLDATLAEISINERFDTWSFQRPSYYANCREDAYHACKEKHAEISQILQKARDTLKSLYAACRENHL